MKITLELDKSETTILEQAMSLDRYKTFSCKTLEDYVRHSAKAHARIVILKRGQND